MEKLEKIVLLKGATSVIEFDFTGLNMPEDSTCQFVMKKKINDDVICKLEFKESKKYYVMFRDEFTAGLDRTEYRYDIMLMVEDERYRQSYTSDIVVEKVVNEYTGPINNEAVEIIADSVEDVEVSQSVKITNTNVIIVKSKMQEKNVIPTKEKQVITPDLDFTGLSKVNVEKIPDEYVIPVLQDKTINVKPGDYYNVMADEGFDGLRVVNAVGIVDVENVEITPTKEEQNISRSEGKYIENVKVNAIPDNYIEPSGELEITENGSYDVKDKASVKVATSGVDINEYLDTNFVSSIAQTTQVGHWIDIIKKIPRLNVKINSSGFFRGFKGTEIENIENLDLTKNSSDKYNTSFNYLFHTCINLKSLDLNKWDVSHITDMGGMFQNCTNLETINFEDWDVSSVTSMASMFMYASKLKNINLSKWKFSPTGGGINSMFYQCASLEELDLRGFNISQIERMNSLFLSCVKLKTLNMDGWDASNISGNNYNGGFTDMLKGCAALENLTFMDNLGKGFTATASNNQYSKLDLSTCTSLTHDSLMNVINKLYDLNLTYDVANGGTLKTQQLILGETNIAKLSEAELDIARNKGWTVS